MLENLPPFSDFTLSELKILFFNMPIYTLAIYYMFIYVFYKVSENFFYLKRNKIWNKYLIIISRNTLYIAIIISYSHYSFSNFNYNGIFSISMSFIIVLGVYYFSKWFIKLDWVKKYLNIQSDKWFENKKLKEKILVGKTDKIEEVRYIYQYKPDVILNQNDYNNLVKRYKTTDNPRFSLKDIEKPENYTKEEYVIPEKPKYKEEYITKKEEIETQDNIPFDFTIRFLTIFILGASFLGVTPAHIALYILLIIFLFTNIYGGTKDIKNNIMAKTDLEANIKMKVIRNNKKLKK